MQFFLTILVIIIIDQLTKYLSTSLTEKVTLIHNVLWFNQIYNTGAAFGLFQGGKVFLGLLNVLISLVIVKYVIERQYKNWLPLALIVGGAIGNAIDRFLLVGVIDFIDLGWWPIFNIADSVIVIGIIWLIWLELSSNIKREKISK